MTAYSKFVFAVTIAAAGTLSIAPALAGMAGAAKSGMTPVPVSQMPLVHADGADGGTRSTLARKLERRLKARAIREGRDPNRIWVNPERVPFNISGAYANRLYYDFYPEARPN